jgi:DNA-binding response OmpR family regulator
MEECILIIDDDKKLNALLSDYLSGFKYSVRSSADPQEGLLLVEKLRPDVIVLDIMLPGMDGFEVLKRIRGSHDIPVIMLTARGEVPDRIVGLSLGADDYMPKPFEPRELVARIQSILRRARGQRGTKEARVFGELSIDLNGRTASIGGHGVELTAMEFDALSLLSSEPARVFTRDQLQERLKGCGWEAFDRSIDVLVSRVRQKLGDDPKKPRYIRTVRGSGYAFTGTREHP